MRMAWYSVFLLKHEICGNTIFGSTLHWFVAKTNNPPPTAEKCNKPRWKWTSCSVQAHFEKNKMYVRKQPCSAGVLCIKTHKNYGRSLKIKLIFHLKPTKITWFQTITQREASLFGTELQGTLTKCAWKTSLSTKNYFIWLMVHLVLLPIRLLLKTSHNGGWMPASYPAREGNNNTRARGGEHWQGLQGSS